jgi:hypothetical protein
LNLRNVSRGDAALAGAALLLLISSFLPYYSAGCGYGYGGTGCTVNAWHSSLFPLLPSVFLLGVIAAALVLAARLLPQGDVKLAGIQLSHWGAVLSVASLWSALWSLLGGPFNSHSVGAYLAFLFALLLAGAAVAGPMLPVLTVPLLPNTPTPGANGPGGYPAYGQPGYPGQPGHPGQPGQHPYPGQQFQHGEPVQQAQPGQPFTGPQPPNPQGGPQAGYGYPQQHQQPGAPQGPGPAQAGGYGAPAPAPEPASTPEDAPPREDPSTALLTPVVRDQQTPAAEPTSEPRPEPQSLHKAEPTPAAATPAAATPAATPAAAPVADEAPAFAPFWFAVPAPRPIAPEQDAHGAPVGELVPGTWYLAIAQRGNALLTQTQEGKRGLLTDTSGIQRG